MLDILHDAMVKAFVDLIEVCHQPPPHRIVCQTFPLSSPNVCVLFAPRHLLDRHNIAVLENRAFTNHHQDHQNNTHHFNTRLLLQNSKTQNLTKGSTHCSSAPFGANPPSHVEIQDSMYALTVCGTKFPARRSASVARKAKAVAIVPLLPLSSPKAAQESSSGSFSGDASSAP